MSDAPAPPPALRVTDPVLLAFADEVGDTGPVAVEGAGTRWQVGGVLATDTRLVTAPVGIVEHQPSEMVVTVRAGTSVADLHTALADTGQTTALPDRGGTVGGAVAVGENRLDRLGRGSVRDAVLQVRYVSSDGALVTGGGPVVKNVSGFNLPKLLVGSLGTLGLVAEVVLRTVPVPPVQQWVRADGADPQALRDTLLRPGAVLWDGTRTWLLIEGYPVDVDEQLANLGALATITPVEGPPELLPYRRRLSPAEAARAPQFVEGAFLASIGVGTVWATSAQPRREPDPVIAALTARIKESFDPTGRLNPGRTPGG